MRQVLISIEAVEDGVPASARITLEVMTSGEWRTERQYEVVAGTKEATRKMLVCDGERIVIEQIPTTRLVYDRTHNLVSKKEADE